MKAYQLLARCRHMQLLGQDEDGDLEWTGTLSDLIECNKELDTFKFKEIWR